MRLSVSAAAVAAALASASFAAAQTAPGAPASDTPPPVVHDIRAEIPVVGLTSTAFGATRRSAGMAGFAGVLGGGSAPADTTQMGGGGRIWGSPVDRLTILVEVNRRFHGEVAPSATAMVRIAGDRARGWGIGASLGYKAEGFTELAGEIEGALLLSVERRRFHADLNLVFGGGVEEREVDSEVKVRLGYDVTPWMRIGADSRFRHRISGEHTLAGGRVGDFVAGPEVVFGYKYFFAALYGGPATYRIAEGVGWIATTTVGGAYFW